MRRTTSITADGSVAIKSYPQATANVSATVKLNLGSSGTETDGSFSSSPSDPNSFGASIAVSN